MSDSLIVPFGKYKGQPVEVLSNDKRYMDWLTAQSWFRDRFPDVHTIIVNNFREPSHTPEHNALQAVFLDNDYCIRLYLLLFPSMFKDFPKKMRARLVETKKELECILEYHDNDDLTSFYNKVSKALLTDTVTSVFPISRYVKTTFEDKVDVLIEAGLCANDILIKYDYSHSVLFKYRFDVSFPTARIEVKPYVSDDYPAVLRQMRASHSNVLFLEDYTGRGVTESQFIEIFRKSNIRVVFDRDVPSAEDLVHVRQMMNGA